MVPRLLSNSIQLEDTKEVIRSFANERSEGTKRLQWGRSFIYGLFIFMRITKRFVNLISSLLLLLIFLFIRIVTALMMSTMFS